MGIVCAKQIIVCTQRRLCNICIMYALPKSSQLWPKIVMKNQFVLAIAKKKILFKFNSIIFEVIDPRVFVGLWGMLR